jgi:O-acetylserine/cysteine efflux transporter
VAQVTPWLLLVPVLAVALGIAFWGDRPGPRLWLGGAMVLGGGADHRAAGDSRNHA